MSHPFISENICRTIRHEFYNSFESRKKGASLLMIDLAYPMLNRIALLGV